MTIPAKTQQVPTPQTIEDVLIKGDLSNLNPEQRKEYYLNVCRSLGLNPLTQPFTYLTLNGRLMLYANRTCSDQLRKVNGISIEVIRDPNTGELFDYKDGVLAVHVRAKDREGRQDEELGVVSMSDQLKGEARANTIMKCITKAKRRVTLSISGLGWSDETEVEDIPRAAKGPSVDPETGEILEGHAKVLAVQAELNKPIEPKPFVPPDLVQMRTESLAHAAKMDTAAAPSKAAEALTSIAKHSTDGEPHQIVLTDPVDWIWFGQQMIGYARTDKWSQWRGSNTTSIARMENEAPKVFARMKSAIDKLTS